MRISFFDFIGFSYDHQTVEKRAIGGTQALAATLAFYLARMGIDVTFYTAGPHRYRLDGVDYVGLDQRPETTDVAIFVGLLQPDLIYRIKQVLGECYFVLWWHGNRFDGTTTGWIAEIFDRIVVVSQYALDKNTARLPNGKLALIRNFLPVLPEVFEEFASTSHVAAKQAGLMAYVGAVTRGLEHLPFLLSKLREKGIDFKVRIFSGMNLYGPDSALSGEEPDFVRRCRADPNVEYMKVVGKVALLRELADVSILLGPNPFRESFCLSLIEAMWMEVLCVSTNRAAIPETAGGYGLLAPVLDPSSDEKFSAVDVDSYLERVVEALSNYQALSGTLGLQKQYVSTSFNPKEAARQWRSALEGWLH